MIDWNMIITSLASSGITVLTVGAACKWIVKKVIDGILSVHNEKLVAEFNNSLEKQNKLLDTKLNYQSHILTRQYDEEFKNYLEIWNALQKYVDETCYLRVLTEAPAFNYEAHESEWKGKDKKWIEYQKNFMELVNSKAPFYQKKHYTNFLRINSLCESLYNSYKGKSFSFEIDSNLTKEKIKEIEEVKDETLDLLRDYLQSLRKI